MLRITREHQNGSQLLTLEGKLLGPWTQELLAQLPPDPAALVGTRLNLRAVSFVDASGAAALRRLIERGAVIESPSTFISELLNARNSR